MKKITFLILLAYVFIACRNESIYLAEDPYHAEFNKVWKEDMGPIDPNQNWNMAVLVTAQVHVDWSTGSEYTIKAYTANPRLEPDNTYQLGEFKVNDGTTSDLKMDIPADLDRIYIGCINQKKERIILPMDIDNGTGYVSFGKEDPTRPANNTLHATSRADGTEKGMYEDAMSAAKGVYVEIPEKFYNLINGEDGKGYFKPTKDAYTESNLLTNFEILVRDTSKLKVFPVVGDTGFKTELGYYTYSRYQLDEPYDERKKINLLKQECIGLNDYPDSEEEDGEDRAQKYTYYQITTTDEPNWSYYALRCTNGTTNASNPEPSNDPYLMVEASKITGRRGAIQDIKITEGERLGFWVRCAHRCGVYDWQVYHAVKNTADDDVKSFWATQPWFDPYEWNDDEKKNPTDVNDNVCGTAPYTKKSRDYQCDNGVATAHTHAGKYRRYSDSFLNNTIERKNIGYCAVAETEHFYLVGLEDGWDHDCNDIIWAIPKAEGIYIVDPDSPTNTMTWTLGFEDLGAISSSDFDFNDVVLIITKEAGLANAQVYLAAAGGTLKTELFYNGIQLQSKDNGQTEIHAMIPGGEGKDSNGKPIYNMWNTDYDTPSQPIRLLANYNGVVKELELGKDFYFANNVENFSIKVQRGDDTYITVTVPTEGGVAPQAIVVPGKWKWPKERQRINKVYTSFDEWGANYADNNWYKQEPVTGLYVTPPDDLPSFNDQQTSTENQ
ncbi:DUF4842 domain-containing protein [uncultured Bacteroides sp.]|uniref:DUF4842 domain-containing protein n=1 Tax=uncultured Bacteroides sp. TaxID=162156 RepID=UPI002626FDCC|nr:DUF4842 domain-containing protein [uncultured Bacteroides sp.]